MRPGDERVLARIGRSPAGASAVDIAKAALGPRARKLSVEALTMTGLAIAARLCGEQAIVATRANNFKLAPRTSPRSEQSRGCGETGHREGVAWFDEIAMWNEPQAGR